MFYCSAGYCISWLLSLWIALYCFWVTNCSWVCQARPKPLPKRATSIESYCPVRPNSVEPHPKNYKKKFGFGCPTKPPDLGSGWAARPNILGFGCAPIPKDIIICIINILNFIIIIKNNIICIINIIFYYN